MFYFHPYLGKMKPFWLIFGQVQPPPRDEIPSKLICQAPERPSFAGVADWGGWAVTLGDTYSDGSGYLAGDLIWLEMNRRNISDDSTTGGLGWCMVCGWDICESPVWKGLLLIGDLKGLESQTTNIPLVATVCCFFCFFYILEVTRNNIWTIPPWLWVPSYSPPPPKKKS